MDTKSNLLERQSKLNFTYLETKVQLSINTIVLHFQFDLLILSHWKNRADQIFNRFLRQSESTTVDISMWTLRSKIFLLSFFIRLSRSSSSFLCVHFMSVYVRPIKWHCIKTVDNRAGKSVTRWEVFLCMAIRQPETSLNR